MDTLSGAERSQRMGLVKSKNTKPELAVRRLVHAMGFRYRLHGKNLPGKPDLVFKTRRKVIFVHGCFWHRHEGCALCRMPKSRVEFWSAKLEANKERDVVKQAALISQGWRYLIVWECEIRDKTKLSARISEFLEPGSNRDCCSCATDARKSSRSQPPP